MKYLIIICGTLFLGIVSNLLIFTFSRIFLQKKVISFLKGKNILMIILNIILFISNFIAVFILSYLFDHFGFIGIIYSVILYILFVIQNIFSRVNKIKNNISIVKLMMPDPENYNKSNDLKKEYWRLFFEIIGLLLGLAI